MANRRYPVSLYTEDAIRIFCKKRNKPEPWCEGQINHILDEHETAIKFIERQIRAEEGKEATS